MNKNEFTKNVNITDKEALDFHKNGRPGKISIKPTKPLLTQRDLALAYSPGVAVPCLEISKDPSAAYKYTALGNSVAVISNGTAVLGLGNLGAIASKPVMEGKAVLFKRFADIDAIDLEIDTTNPEEFINCVKFLGKSFGGINLEDIKAPECFIIENKLKELLDIPVFHDDQHGTAIITLAGLINATHITNRKFEDLKIVVNGAGSAGIACIKLIKSYGVPAQNIILCDTKGVIYKGRTENMNFWKEELAIDTSKRTLAEAIKGADVFLGLSVKGAITKEMVKSMANKPIIFAMANPDPEILPEDIKSVRDDAIIATGRSDYPNQINNVMCFPYIFRGALDVQAKIINEEMKIAAAEALADLARETIPEEVYNSYSIKRLHYGPDYIIPVPFDSRLIIKIPIAVAKAAIKSKIARNIITNFDEYENQLGSRLDPCYSTMSEIFEKIKANPIKIIFAEGEEEQIIRAALLWKKQGYGTPILVGREKNIKETLNKISPTIKLDDIEIWNAANIDNKVLDSFIELFYNKTHRNGNLYRDCVRLVKNNRNIFASCMLETGLGDTLITGVTRGYHDSLKEISSVIDTKPNSILFSVSIFISENGGVYFLADTTVNEDPSPSELADITEQTVRFSKNFGYTPRVALLSYANFGNPKKLKSQKIKEAVEILNSRKVDFEYDGEMTADVALNADLMKHYPFCNLSKPANILIMPSLNSANIVSKILSNLGNGTVFGPILCGLDKPMQIIQMGSSVNDIINLSAFASLEAIK